MKFTDFLSEPPRLIVDPALLRPALDSLAGKFPELAAAVLRTEADGELHTLVMHTDPAHAPGTVGKPYALGLDFFVRRRLGDTGCALLHAPFPAHAQFQSLFPGAASVFLRRAHTRDGGALLLAYSIGGVDAEFASRHDANVVTEQIRERTDRHIQQTHIDAVTRKLEDQINEVKVIKEKLLPAADHHVHGLRFAVHYQPCAGGGGDYYEIADLRNARERVFGVQNEAPFWGAIIADVSGHGPGAAVEVTMLDAILRTYHGSTGHHPGRVLSYCNEHVFTRQLRGGFSTVVISHYDAVTRTLTYANAGHPPPIVKPAAADAPCRLLDEAADIPLGVDTDHEWSSAETMLDVNDILVLYTDGVSEAKSPEGKEFGTAGILAAMRNSNADTPEALMADIVNALHAHAGRRPIPDDCTIVAVQPAQ